MAIAAGRKILVLSERLAHLETLAVAIIDGWPKDAGTPPTIGYYVGGTSKEDRKIAETKQVILATAQYAQEGLDIPALDTLILATPLSDVEQATGRILRPFDGKKPPIVVDIRDDKIPMFKAMARKRQILYAKIT
jgi:superfamily II DNA or RNA helicase